MKMEEALELDRKLSIELAEIARGYCFDESIAISFMEKCVEIYSDEDDEYMKGFIKLGTTTASYKIENICFDLKKAIITALEYAASVSIPDSKCKLMQVLILSAIWVVKSIRIEVKDEYAILLMYMHRKNMYLVSMCEEEVISGFQTWYLERFKEKVDKELIQNGISFLYRLQCIEINEGNIVLCEKIFGTR